MLSRCKQVPETFGQAEAVAARGFLREVIVRVVELRYRIKPLGLGAQQRHAQFSIKLPNPLLDLERGFAALKAA